MEFYLPGQDPDIERLPPEKVHILELRAEPYPDGRRVRVNMDMTPFEKRPHIEISLTDAGGHEVASASFIEPMAWKLEFTLHIRGEDPASPYTLSAHLFYPDGVQAEPIQTTFEISEPD
jgi:hypothetical protein